MLIFIITCSGGYIMINKFCGIALLVALLLASCLSTGSSQKTQDTIPAKIVEFSSDELTVVNRLFASVNKNDGVILIRKELYTLSPSDGDYLKKEAPEINTALIEAFVANNTAKSTLDENTSFDTNFIWYDTFAADNRSADLSISAWWSKIWEILPDFNGTVDLSRISFNSDMSQAIAYIGVRKGPMNGSGNFLILNKKDGIWEVVKVIYAWIS
jgi:hypothetical protein